MKRDVRKDPKPKPGTPKKAMQPAKSAEPKPPFDRQSVPRELRPFLDDEGRLAQWPGKQKTQRIAVAYLTTKFEPGRIYNEKQVNELLNDWHTFEDWALLRRVMFDWAYLDRESDGSKYWVRDKAGPPGQARGPAATSPA